MSTMAVPQGVAGRVRFSRPAPWAYALVGAFAVAVVVGGSVAATQAVLGDRLDAVSTQMTTQVAEQTRRAEAAQADLTALRSRVEGEAALAARRAADAQAQITALRTQLAAETARSAQAQRQILDRVAAGRP
jgi:hypothetical protein